MNLREDRRPTLASWPKRMYDWSEVPHPFQSALADWNAAGMPPGNITLIPRVHQYSGAPEYVTAWFGGEVCLQRLADGKLDVWSIRPGDVAQVGYSVQLIKCTVTVWLKDGSRTGFSYNKTKEDQLYPVLSLLLGNPPTGARPCGIRTLPLLTGSGRKAMPCTTPLSWRIASAAASWISSSCGAKTATFFTFFSAGPTPSASAP